MLRNPHPHLSDTTEATEVTVGVEGAPARPLRRMAPAAVGGFVALGLLATACVSPKAPTVGIKPISADIVFGLTPKAKPISLPGTPDLVPGPTGDVIDDSGFDSGFFTSPTVPGKPFTGRTPTTRAAEACRRATINDFAPEPAPFNVSKAPTPGIYKWKYDLVKGFDTKAQTEQRGFVQKTIANVTRPADGVTEFDELATLADGSTSTTHYRVKTNGTQRIVNLNLGVSADPAQLATALIRDETEILLGDGNGIYPTIPAPVAGPINQVNNTLTGSTFSVGDVDRGITITAFTVKSKAGDVVQNVKFSTPLLILPLPVTPGVQWQVAALDPTTLNTITGTGKVSRQAETDACGSVVSGWRVRIELSSTNGSATTNAVRLYNIATQLGGYPTLERFGDDGAADFLEYSLAGVVPSPG